MVENNSFRVMTYNVGSGRENFGTFTPEVMDTITELSPDILGVQESTEWVDADGNRHSMADKIAQSSEFGENYFFGKTISLKENMQVRKNIIVHGIFMDWEDWAMGNALFSRSGFSRLSDAEKPGTPRNIPLFVPEFYQGTRDTDPRYAIISRVSLPPINPFVVNTHLTTLLGERRGTKRQIPGRVEESQILRIQQAKRLLDLLAPSIRENQPIILMGDFNADSKEACIASVLEKEGGFMRLIPSNDIPTLPKVEKVVDHIFAFPTERIAEYNCWVEVNNKSKIASDHLPVVADITFK
jgi:endonuclease/exonuclease/phosphatase family metal-dependent hydrolase